MQYVFQRATPNFVTLHL